MTKPAVFISGAARGIGRATAERFAREGWFVGVYDVDAVGARETVDQLAAANGNGTATGGPLEVTRSEEWARALEEFAAASEGRLDLLVNNAGILRAGRFADVEVAEHHRTIEVNVLGVVNGCHAAYPYLRATPGSGIVNLCSASAIYGQPELATYSASKFAVRGLTEALELEWRKEGISVHAVWPLWVDTGLLEGNDATSTHTLGVHLTVDDVAEQVFALTQPRRLLGRVPRVHTAVGLQAKLLSAAADLVPSLLTREVNRRISHA